VAKQGPRRQSYRSGHKGRWQGRTRGKAELLIAVRARAKRGLRGVSALGAAAALASRRAHAHTRCSRGRGGQRTAVAWLGRGAELLVRTRLSERSDARSLAEAATRRQGRRPTRREGDSSVPRHARGRRRQRIAR
jgi:hypothetical protein